MKFFRAFTVLLALSSSPKAFSKIVQIIHTNDLHSYFQGTRGGIGGYAQLKKVVDRLKSEAEHDGIPSLYLDAGDFGEGSSFYFSNHGVDSLKALDHLGVDVTVLGNHDFILGGKELRNQLKASGLKAKMLSSNLKGKFFMGLNGLVKDYIDYDLDGLKIRIFGLTTSEVHYMYPLRPWGWISDPHNAGIKQATRAKKDGAHFTIALTHIGLPHDIELVQKSRSIDMVVGGHTHIRLGRPQLTKNMEGKLIPIVHAGAHSGYVGSMLLDVSETGEHTMLSYKMIDIKKSMPQDEEMKIFVDEAYDRREKYFGRSWDEVIGYSNIPLSGNTNGNDPEQRTCWSQHMARMTRKTAGTDLGLQFDVFQGEQIPPGPIRFGDIVDNFPHFRKWGDAGWSVSKGRISGFVLKKIIMTLASSEVALQVTIDGIKAKNKNGIGTVTYDPKIHSPEEALVNGEEINSMKYYSVGVPTEIPFAVAKMGFLLLQDLRKIKKSSYWPLLENYIKDNSPLNCLED